MKFLFMVASLILFTAKEDCKQKKGNANNNISGCYSRFLSVTIFFCVNRMRRYQE